MARHIGIVALSPEGSALCYRCIGRRIAEIHEPSRRPLVTMHNRPFASFVEALKRDDWNAVAQILIESAELLAHAGADFCILPDNVAHHALPIVESASPIPWLNMISLVADSFAERQCERIGLIGTRYVMSGSTYQTMLGLRGIRLLVPNEQHAGAIDRIIFNEAVYGAVSESSRRLVHEAVNDLQDRGCEAVILGCSEAPLLLAVQDSTLPVIDPVEILAEAAIAHALRDRHVLDIA